MKAVAASPALHHARALGRAFLGAGRALRRGMTWFLLIAFGVCLPWLAILGRGIVDYDGPLQADQSLASTSSAAVDMAVHSVLYVLLLALLVPVLDGRRDVSLRRLGPPMRRLPIAVAALTGAEMAWRFVAIAGWEDPVSRALGLGVGTLDFAVCLVEAWTAAWVVSAMRDGAWPWMARHLLVGGTLCAAGLIGAYEFIGPMHWGDGVFERLFGFDWDHLPPYWWVIWRLAEWMVALVVLEYLRIEPPHAPAPAQAAP